MRHGIVFKSGSGQESVLILELGIIPICVNAGLIQMDTVWISHFRSLLDITDTTSPFPSNTIFSWRVTFAHQLFQDRNFL